MIRRVDHLLRDPARLVALLVAAQITAWTLAPALTHHALPLDVVESYMWGREWVIATYKHPALPSWVLEASRRLTGAVGWPAYLVSQLFIGATFVFVFLLGRDLMGPRRGAAGTLLLTGIAFYAWPTPEFNHNVAETPFWAALPWVLWRAVERERGGIGWWLLVGAIGAAGLYAKLPTALLLLALALWILWDVRARASLAGPGPWIGLAVFAALAAPLGLWLVGNDFAPLHYAAERSMGRGGPGVFVFVASVALNLVGLFAILALAGLLGPRRYSASPEPPPPRVAPRALAFLVAVTAGPLVIAVIAALASGSILRSAWGSSMFNLAGLLAIALASARFDATALRRIAVCAAGLVTLVPLGYALVVIAGPLRDGAPMRVSWPQRDISQRLVEVWTRSTGRPLRIVSGEPWIAGLVGAGAKDVPSILNVGGPAVSPWITPERVEKEGMLIVWEARGRRIPQPLQQLVDAAPAKEERFRWPSRKGGDLVIGYVIVPPK